MAQENSFTVPYYEGVEYLFILHCVHVGKAESKFRIFYLSIEAQALLINTAVIILNEAAAKCHCHLFFHSCDFIE